MKKAGYQLPTIVPSELACYKIYIPDCLEALLSAKGSLDFLCKVVAWELPGDPRQYQMAQMFLKGDALSWVPCEDTMAGCTCDEIRAIFAEELRKVNIINNFCGCGCGGSGGSGVPIPEPPVETIPFPSPTPSEPYPTEDESYVIYSCRLCNYLVDSLISVTVRFKNLWVGSTLTLDGIITAITLTPALYPYYAFAVQIFAYIQAITGSDMFDQLIALFTTHRAELVCVMHEASSPASSQENLRNAVWSYNEYPVTTRIIALVITSFIPFNSSFEEDAVDIPSTYDNATCCDEIVPEPSPSGLYFYMEEPTEEAADASVEWGLTSVFGDGYNVQYYTEYGLKGQVVQSGGFRVQFGFVNNVGVPTAARIQITAAFGWTGIAGGDYAVVGFNGGTPTNLADLVPGLPYTTVAAYDYYWLTKVGTDVPPPLRLKLRVMP